jgi:hypothetical protein
MVKWQIEVPMIVNTHVGIYNIIRFFTCISKLKFPLTDLIESPINEELKSKNSHIEEKMIDFNIHVSSSDIPNG